jgi:hypothetical protein
VLFVPLVANPRQHLHRSHLAAQNDCRSLAAPYRRPTPRPSLLRPPRPRGTRQNAAPPRSRSPRPQRLPHHLRHPLAQPPWRQHPAVRLPRQHPAHQFLPAGRANPNVNRSGSATRNGGLLADGPGTPAPSAFLLEHTTRLPARSWLQVTVCSRLHVRSFYPGTCTPFTARPCWAHTTAPNATS